MKSLNLYSAGQLCQIKTYDQKLLEEINSKKGEKFILKKVPGGRIIEKGIKDISSILEIRYSEKENLIEEYPNYKISGPEINYRDALVVSEYLLERARQEKGIYNLHSSTIGKNGNCIIVHGASKAGKTVLGLILC